MAEDIDSQLIDAAARGDSAAVQALLKTGANPKALDELGETAMTWASIELAGLRHQLLESPQSNELPKRIAEFELTIQFLEANGSTAAVCLLRKPADNGALVDSNTREMTVQAKGVMSARAGGGPAAAKPAGPSKGTLVR
ncbi:MAG: hypothetical protein WC759_02740 [Candidatus Micrarchaeia archaeon]|jgi:hypothetical protein